jgi:hypothetical protein
VDVNQIKEILKSPRNKDLISKLSHHESRLKLHSQTTLQQAGTGAINEFFEYVRKLIPGDKFQLFLSLFRFPVLTVAETAPIYEKLSRVFDGVNPVFEYTFKVPEDLTDWQQYQDVNFWEREGFKAFRECINSIVIVDLPSEQNTPKPEPYAFLLDVSEVIDIGLSRDRKTIQSICFRPEGDRERLAFYDDEFYRVFATKEGELELGELLVESRHELGYCPANWFWNSEHSPLTKYFSKLDWLLFFLVSKQQLDLHGAYPIYSGYEVDCDYEIETDRGHYECDGGFLRGANAGDWLISSTGDGLQHCPACKSKRISGAGSFVEVPAPQDSTEPDLRNPVQMLTVDRGSLDYNVEESQRLAAEIFTGVTGVQGEAINNQAVNEKQVFAGLESETNVLRTIANGFERIQKWTEETICILRYGALSFEGCSISYGTQFHLYTPDDILEGYNKLKLGGADQMVLDVVQDQWIESKFRNDNEQMTRQQILLHLDPFRHLTKSEVSGLYESGLISREDYLLKVQFSTLIRRFEREQMDINAFGAALDLDKKINKIKEVLYSYIEPQKQIEYGSQETDDKENRIAEGVKA